MTVDFATFNITELEVLDASDTLALPEMGASYTSGTPTTSFVEDMDDLIGEGAQSDITLCCSSSSSSSCCC